MKTRLTIAKIRRAKRRRCFKRWGLALMVCDRMRIRTAENLLEIAFLCVRRCINIGRMEAANPNRNNGFRNVRFIEP